MGVKMKKKNDVNLPAIFFNDSSSYIGIYHPIHSQVPHIGSVSCMPLANNEKMCYPDLPKIRTNIKLRSDQPTIVHFDETGCKPLSTDEQKWVNAIAQHFTSRML